MIPDYDDQNIFAKILRGEIPSQFLYQNEYACAFNDIAPQAPIHVIVIPKGKFVSYEDFCINASPQQILGFNDCVKEVLSLLDLDDGFRVITNIGKDGGQEVPHYHIHIVGGRPLGKLLAST